MRLLFSKIAAFYARISLPVLGCFRMVYATRSLALSDTAWAQRATFAVTALVFLGGVAHPQLVLAQASSATMETSDMVPARFLQMVKGIAALGTLERIDEVVSILGVELEQHNQTLWRSKNISKNPLWLDNASLFFESFPTKTTLGNSIGLILREGTVCVRLMDILAAFPGDYFVYSGPPVSPPVMSSEAAAARRAARSDTVATPRESGPGFTSMFVPVYRPTEGRIEFGFDPWRPCVESVSVRIPFSPTEPVGSFVIYRRVSP